MYDAYYTPLLCKCEPETTGFRFDKNLCVRSVYCGLILLVDLEHDAERRNRKGTASTLVSVCCVQDTHFEGVLCS